MLFSSRILIVCSVYSPGGSASSAWSGCHGGQSPNWISQNHRRAEQKQTGRFVLAKSNLIIHWYCISMFIRRWTSTRIHVCMCTLGVILSKRASADREWCARVQSAHGIRYAKDFHTVHTYIRRYMHTVFIHFTIRSYIHMDIVDCTIGLHAGWAIEGAVGSLQKVWVFLYPCCTDL